MVKRMWERYGQHWPRVLVAILMAKLLFDAATFGIVYDERRSSAELALDVQQVASSTVALQADLKEQRDSIIRIMSVGTSTMARVDALGESFNSFTGVFKERDTAMFNNLAEIERLTLAGNQLVVRFRSGMFDEAGNLVGHAVVAEAEELRCHYGVLISTGEFFEFVIPFSNYGPPPSTMKAYFLCGNQGFLGILPEGAVLINPEALEWLNDLVIEPEQSGDEDEETGA